MLNPRSNFSRSSSRIFRMDNLSCAIDSHPLRAKGTHDIGGYPDLHADVRSSPEGWPACRGIPGRHGAESVAGMRRNQWPASGGIRIRGASTNIGSASAVLLGLSAVIVGCWLLVRVDGLSLSRVSPRRFALVSIGSLLLAIPQAMLAAVYWAYIGGATPSPGFSMSSAAVLVISWMLVDSGIRGIFEEIVFRGFLQPALVRRYEAHPEGQYTAVVATTFLF